MHMKARRATTGLILPLLLLSVSGCDIVTADMKHSETAEWRKSYEIPPGGRVEINNVNGKIDVEPGAGNVVEVIAVKTAKAHSPEGAKQALERVEIVDQSGPSGVRVETKYARGETWFGSNASVRYTVRVPSTVLGKFSNTNGGIELRGVSGTFEATTTNGGIVGREISGVINARSTNGGVDIDLAQVADGGARLACTNGGIVLRLPSNARASITATMTNGGIDTEGLQLETIESSKRRLEARLGGGGPQIRVEGTNGGIKIRAR